MRRNAAERAVWRKVVACCLLVAGLWPANAAGQEESGPPVAFNRLRVLDAKAAQLLRAGAVRSATFRTLVETIERSDLLVWVETRPMKLPGQVQLLGATPGWRRLRITVRTPGLDNEMVAWLGHELWHAVEVAGAPEVRDQSSLRAFYKRIGTATSEDTVESSRAQEVWMTVLREARSAERSR